MAPYKPAHIRRVQEEEEEEEVKVERQEDKEKKGGLNGELVPELRLR